MYAPPRKGGERGFDFAIRRREILDISRKPLLFYEKGTQNLSLQTWEGGRKGGKKGGNDIRNKEVRGEGIASRRRKKKGLSSYLLV